MFCKVLGLETKAFHMVGQHPTTEPHHQAATHWVTGDSRQLLYLWTTSPAPTCLTWEDSNLYTVPDTVVILKSSQIRPQQPQWEKVTDRDHEAHLPESQGDREEGQKVGKVNETWAGQELRISGAHDCCHASELWEKAVRPFIFTLLYLRLGSDSDCMSSWHLLSILMNAFIPYHVQIQSLSFIGAFTESSQDSSITRAMI